MQFSTAIAVVITSILSTCASAIIIPSKTVLEKGQTATSADIVSKIPIVDDSDNCWMPPLPPDCAISALPVIDGAVSALPVIDDANEPKDELEFPKFPNTLSTSLIDDGAVVTY